MKKLLLIVLLAIFSTSCSRIYLGLVSSKKVITETFYNEELDKTLVCFPMVHLNKPEFYEDVRKKLTNLREEGYVVYYEGIKFDSLQMAKPKIDSLKRKMRKLLGFNFTNYKDSTNKSFPKFFKNKKYALQTRESIGINENDINVDFSVSEIITNYETNHGKIILTECDLETPLNDKYECDVLPKVYENEVIVYARNDKIFQAVKNSRHQKIALVYGKMHFTNALYGRFQGKEGYKWLDK